MSARLGLDAMLRLVRSRSRVAAVLCATPLVTLAATRTPDAVSNGPVAAAPSKPAVNDVAHWTKDADASAADARIDGMSSSSAALDAALRALSTHVKRSSDPEALKTAFRAYFNYRAARGEEVRKPYLYFVDLGLDNATPRGYVFDMDALTLIEGPFMVAHGRGSSKQRNAVPTTFSNRSGSKSSSLGVYLAQETYTFGGKSGGRHYSSVGLRMRGESGQFNSAARARGIVAHGAPYVTSREAGRSEGCPAMELPRANRLLPKIANGGVVVIYSPNDARWLSEDPWLQTS